MTYPLQIITPLLKVCTIFAVFPPYHFYSSLQKTSKTYKIYSIFFLILLVNLYVHQTHGRLTSKIFEIMPVVSQLVDGITSLILMLFCVRTTILTFLKSSNLKSFVYDLECFDDSIQQQSTRRGIFVGFNIFIHIFMIGLIVTNSVVVRDAMGMDSYNYQIATNVLSYQYFIGIFMIYWFGIEIWLRYRTINNVLSNTVIVQKKEALSYIPDVDSQSSIFINVKSKNILAMEAYHLKKIALWYDDISDVLEKYNHLFGNNILLFVLCEMASILDNTVKILSLTVFRESTEVEVSNIVYFSSTKICISLVRIHILLIVIANTLFKYYIS